MKILKVNYQQAVLHLKKSGKDYIEYVQSVGYRKIGMNDFQVMIENAERNASLCNIDLYGKDKFGIIPKESSVVFSKILKREIEKISHLRNNISKKENINFEER